MIAQRFLTQRRSGAMPAVGQREFFTSSVAPLRRCVSIFLLTLSLCACSRSPAGPLAFVTNERDGAITVIDTATDRVHSTIKVGGRLR